MHRVLFVCLGNICRSAMAEGVLKKLVRDSGREREFEIDSAGTSSWHIGEPPDRNAQKTALARGYDLADQRARQIVPEDFYKFDVIIGMDDQNITRLKTAAPDDCNASIGRLLDYAPGQGERNVPDPWNCGRDAFEHTLDLVEAGCQGLLDTLPSES